MKKKKTFKCLSISVTLALCIIHIYYSAIYDSSSSYNLFLLIVSILSITGTFYFLFSITMDAIKDARQTAELLALEQQQKLKEEQNHTLAEYRQRALSLQQDIKQKLETYRAMMEAHDYEKATAYLDALTNGFRQESFHPVCNNNLINAVLDSKRHLATQHGIQTNFQLLLPEKTGIKSSDLSSIFFNLMDNAIESCQQSHSDSPFIQITAKQNANFLAIHMTNSKDSVQKFDHKTNKTDSWSHGFGLAIIEDIVDRYDGTCQWIDNGGTFESIVMVGMSSEV